MKWFRRRTWEQRMDAEFGFHLEACRRNYIAQGLSPAEADRRARREFGALELAKDECRDEKPTAWFEGLSRDLRIAGRALRKSPGFTIAAIATLALGIGANTAIFQLLDALTLRTLPVHEPARLATVQLADRTGWRGNQETQYPALTNPIWERFRDTQQAFAGALAWGETRFNLNPGPGGEAHTARGLFVSGEFFHVLGVQPIIGRTFTAADDRRGCGLPGAVVSYAFWQRELGGDPSVAGNGTLPGRKLTLNYQPVEVIGVTPAAFSGLEIGRAYDVAVPICSQAVLWSEGNWLNAGTVWWLNVLGRLRPGETLPSANARLHAASPALFESTLPKNYPRENVKDFLKFRLAAVPAANGVSGLREQYSNPLLLLLATSGLVLLVACANLANLILARAVAREHEFAVRLAIGASRARLIRQLMVESLLLSVGGAAAGVALAGALSRFLVGLLGNPRDPLFLNLQPDWRMLAFTIGLTTLNCILFGLAPALRATRVAPGDAMKSAARTVFTSRHAFGFRQILVVAQVSLSLALMAGALLFSGSLRNLYAIDAGFRHQGILTADLNLSSLKIPAANRVAFKHDLLQKFRAIPGIASACESGFLPLSGAGVSNRVWRDGAPPESRVEASFMWFGDHYLATLGATLIAGRDFTDRDIASAPKVAIVNQSFARKMGLGPNPIGVKFHREPTPDLPEQVYEIVGLVRDTKYYNLREEFLPIAFLEVDQEGTPNPYPEFVIRSTLPVAQTAGAIRRAIHNVSPQIGTDLRSYESTVDEGLLRERLMATLSAFFGALAALISAVGLYGVMSYMVAKRTREIGLRIALGADRRRIVASILREAVSLLAIGIVIGIGLTLAIGTAAGSILFGLKPYDPATISLAALLLTAVTLAATSLPARRAANLEPVVALREE